MILEPKHKNFAGLSEIKETVKKIFNIRRHMSTPRAFECNYFKIILNWWHSPFKCRWSVKVCKMSGFLRFLSNINQITALRGKDRFVQYSVYICIWRDTLDCLVALLVSYWPNNCFAVFHLFSQWKYLEASPAPLCWPMRHSHNLPFQYRAFSRNDAL
jgi:hypothetical protein